jgi:hypothetical protein
MASATTRNAIQLKTADRREIDTDYQAEHSHQPESLLKDDQAAVRLGVSAATLRSWRCRGIGPNFVKMGAGKKSPVRYSASDIDEFISQWRQVPPVRAAVEN